MLTSSLEAAALSSQRITKPVRFSLLGPVASFLKESTRCSRRSYSSFREQWCMWTSMDFHQATYHMEPHNSCIKDRLPGSPPFLIVCPIISQKTKQSLAMNALPETQPLLFFPHLHSVVVSLSGHTASLSMNGSVCKRWWEHTVAADLLNCKLKLTVSISSISNHSIKSHYM